MPSRSEGWGGLFKDEQYRLIRSASRAFIRWLRSFEQTTPPLRGFPSLLRRGMVSAFGQTVNRGLRSNGPPDLRLVTLFMTGYTRAN